MLKFYRFDEIYCSRTHGLMLNIKRFDKKQSNTTRLQQAKLGAGLDGRIGPGQHLEADRSKSTVSGAAHGDGQYTP
jgi:hypothetical protein